MAPTQKPQEEGGPAEDGTGRSAHGRHDKTARRPRQTTEGGKLQPAVGDVVPVEAPLSIQVTGETLVTTMRTPGDDHALAMGFLLAEGLIDSAADVSRIVHCGDPTDPDFGHTIDVSPGAGTIIPLEGKRRGTLSLSSCGVCGRTQIRDLVERLQPPRETTLSIEEIHRAMDRLREGQEIFRQTGALHGAAVYSKRSLLALAEDVGRHNAIDKAIGRTLLDQRLDDAMLLAISGRASFEVVQKAAAARIPVVAAAKGPSSMAIDLAEAIGLTLCGFVRDDRLNLYTHAQRIR